ncbi:hypothetical protein BDF14DRAFT_1722046 [Spinellus fusiger]|nr:hypothetical protein BDF14DRAFT_1722046 [Spinellus fusiger]
MLCPEPPHEAFYSSSFHLLFLAMQSSVHLALCLPEIVTYIFSFLDCQPETSLKDSGLLACLVVNRLWHDCAMPSVWRRVEFEESKDMTALVHFSKVFSSMAHTSDILSSKDNTSPQSMFTYQRHTLSTPVYYSHLDMYRMSLRHLSLRKIKDKSIDEPLIKMAAHATQLNYLDVYICDYFTNAALVAFLANPTLTYLSLAGCYRIDDDAILQVAMGCPHLEHLDVRACGLISDLSVSAIAMGCPHLRHLNVGRIRERHRVTHNSIDLIAKHTQVTVLGLAGCDIDDACMIQLAHLRGAFLERISINSCYRVTNKTLRAYVEYCPRLSVFEMKECPQVNDWEAVATLVQRKVLLTLCDDQSQACTAWARRKGRCLEVKAPVK